MKYRLHDLPVLLGSPLGQAELRTGLFCRAWPVVGSLAAAYRRSLVRRTHLVAVTGSHGKTTTMRAIAAALGVRLHRRSASNFSSFLAASVLRIRPGQPHAVLEVGAHGLGDIARYARTIRPDVAVVTTIGSEHRNSLRTTEGTRREKSDLVAALPPHGLAVLNGDDPNVLWMRERTRARVVTCGFGADCEVRASDYGLDWPHGSRFLLHLDGQTHQVRSRLVGRHQVYSILAAVTVARHEGVPLERALEAAGQIAPTPGRLEIVPLPNGAYLLRDDYKGTIETIEVALETLAEVPAARKIVVLGDISEPPADKYAAYRRIGKRVGQVADRVVCVGEQSRRYRGGFWAGGLAREAVAVAGRSVRRAIGLVGALQPGDVVLLKGQGAQRLERVALALAGRVVHCDLSYCPLTMPRCTACALLEREWDAQPVLRAPERRQATASSGDGGPSPTPASGGTR